MKPQDRTRAILNSVLPSMQRLILIAICDHMGTNDTAFPGLPTVARLAGMSERRTKGHIKAMSDAGILVRRHRPGPQPPIYTVRWEALTGDETSPGTKRHQGRSVPPTRDGASPLTGDGASLRSDQGSDQEATTNYPPVPGADHQEQNDERNENDHADVGRLRGGVGSDRPSSPDDERSAANMERDTGNVGDDARGGGTIPKQSPTPANGIDVVAIWEHVNAHKPGRALRLTPSRKQQIKAREKEHGPGSVARVARWVYTSHHDRARYLRDNDYGPKTWLRPSNFTGYLERADEEAPPPQKPKPDTPQLPDDIRQYRYDMSRCYPRGIPEEMAALWKREDQDQAWSIPTYDD